MAHVNWREGAQGGSERAPHLASVKAEHRKVRPPLWAYLGDGLEGAQI